MACTSFTSGRLEGCNDNVGGLANVYFINSGESWTLDSDDLATLDGAGTPSAYKYELRGTSTFEQNIQANRDNGTTFVEQTLTVSLKAQDSTTHKEVKLLAHDNPTILVEDNNGNVFVMGHEYGATLTGGATSTGATMGDKSGYELTFVATERVLAPFTQESLSSTYSVEAGS